MVKNIINSITSKTSVFHIKKALFENEVVSLNHNLKWNISEMKSCMFI